MPLPAETIAGAGSVLGVTVSLAKEGFKDLKRRTARSKAKDTQTVLNEVQQTLINKEGDLVLAQADHDNYHGEYRQCVFSPWFSCFVLIIFLPSAESDRLTMICSPVFRLWLTR